MRLALAFAALTLVACNGSTLPDDTGGGDDVAVPVDAGDDVGGADAVDAGQPVDVVDAHAVDVYDAGRDAGSDAAADAAVVDVPRYDGNPCDGGMIGCFDLVRDTILCVDPQADPLNCGGCGMTCYTTNGIGSDVGTCTSGSCAPCAPGMTTCRFSGSVTGGSLTRCTANPHSPVSCGGCGTDRFDPTAPLVESCPSGYRCAFNPSAPTGQQIYCSPS